MNHDNSSNDGTTDGTTDATATSVAVDHGGYWRSLAELESAAEYQRDKGDEFPTGAGTNADGSDPLSRRNFFQLMGASLALAGVAGPGCHRYEKDEIVPLARRPEDMVPGNPQQYASVFELAGAAQALLVTSYEGRPIKIDGNPEHPFAGGGVVQGTARHGGSSAFAQGSILHVYDPDRSTTPMQDGHGATFDGFKHWLDDARKAMTAKPGTVRILSEATSSPTIAALKKQVLAAMPGAQWAEYEPVSWDNERAGTKLAFGRALRPLAKLDKAETILALDCDIFVEHPASLRYSRDFARSRRTEGSSLGGNKMNRLWSVESTFSSTGALADHRLPLRSELVLPLLMAVDAAISGGSAPTSEFLKETKTQRFVQVLIEELQANKGRAVLLAGRRQPAAVHALVAKINAALDAHGNTLDYVEDFDADRPSHLDAITALAKDMAAGQVQYLFILGGNPLYDAPADLNFAAALAKVPNSVHLAEYQNETSQKTNWHLPRAHYLEAWNDARTWDGTVTVGQPLIMPIYGGIAPSELLSLILGEGKTSDVLVRAAFDAAGNGQLLGSGNWRQAVHDGFVAGTASPAAAVSITTFAAPALTATQLGSSRVKNGELEIVFAPSTSTFDGRFANNAWLQETPDFLTKVTWDNYALVSPATAEELGLKNDSIIKVKVGGRELAVACYTMPGQARFSIGLVLGGGRTAAGRIGGDGGKRVVGFDTNRVRSTTGFDIAGGATVSQTGDDFELANVQDHWDLRQGIAKQLGNEEIAKRIPNLVRETTARELHAGYKATEESETFTDAKRGKALYEEHVYAGHKWAMAIDLGNCTGCNSCMVACQSENNVPAVGKQQVINNREMHWIRIDRYFKGAVDDPEIVHQPLACQQCENAPCEQVCPVGATTHSDEGLNDMAYNRCIGTRYCLNNCPYRVRRFNFFNYNTQFSESRNKVRKLLFNPEVTVRFRGVMEKCSYCVQRIQNTKIAAKRENRQLVDGEIVTACQSACPTEAIVFGDLSDKTSRVSRLHGDKRAYGLLDDVLYTKPRTQFLARVRNPNPKLVVAGEGREGAHHEGGH